MRWKTRGMGSHGLRHSLAIPACKPERKSTSYRRQAVIGADLCKAGRKRIVRAYKEHGYRIREIAAHLGVHYATVSRRLKEMKQEE